MVKHTQGRWCLMQSEDQVPYLEQRVVMFIIHVALKFFASGSYAIIYIYANELFPTQARNTGMGICSMVARVGAIIGTLSNDLLVTKTCFPSQSLKKNLYLFEGACVDSLSHCFLRYFVVGGGRLRNDLPWNGEYPTASNHWRRGKDGSCSVCILRCWHYYGWLDFAFSRPCRQFKPKPEKDIDDNNEDAVLTQRLKGTDIWEIFGFGQLVSQH